MADAMKLLPCPMCGGEAALLDYEARYGGLHYASRCPQCTSCGCSMGYLPTAKKAVEAWNRRASPPAREEAPAEGAGDLTRGQIINAICNASPFGPDYKHPDLLRMSDAILALRVRTSEPEAGAVAWRWRDLNRCRVGVTLSKIEVEEQRALDNEIQPLYLHPAPATADKLKVAKEALAKIASRRSIVFGRGEMSGQEAFGIATDALAILNEQPQ